LGAWGGFGNLFTNRVKQKPRFRAGCATLKRGMPEHVRVR
jgi:hypothetical protein